MARKRIRSRLRRGQNKIIVNVLRSEIIIETNLEFTSHPSGENILTDGFVNAGSDKQPENLYFAPIQGANMPDIKTEDVLQDTTSGQRYNVVSTPVNLGNQSRTLRVPVDKVLQ